VSGHPAARAAHVVEQYLPRPTAADVEPFVAALHAAAAAAGSEGAPVRLVCSLLVADDDLCLHVIEAASPAIAARVAAAGGITAERTASATAWWPPDDREGNNR
jgi:methylmalonyl-CoA mutase cobalamin-binding subunit